MLVSIIVPVFNEAATVEQSIRAVHTAPLPEGVKAEIIVVDDGSGDGSAGLVEDLELGGVTLIRHEKNRGKGAAIRSALKEVKGEIVIIQDADLEYDPVEYPSLLEPILSGKADVVYGSRFITGNSRRVHLFGHYIGNITLTFLSNCFSNYNLSDMETCYKVFRTDVVRRLDLRENGFGIEAELTQKFARLKARVYEVGISYNGRGFEAGKKIKPIRDGLVTLMCILRYGLGMA